MRPSLLTLVLVLLIGCSSPEISQERVERIISTLAADDMRGRGAFTEDADRAAAFIAAEFADIGLAPLPGDTDYIQDFPVYQVSAGPVGVSINGKAAERVAASLGGVIAWTMGSGPAPTVVPAGGDLMGAWRSARGADALLVVHPSHAETFDRIAGFLARPSRSLDASGAPSLVMVLAPDTRVSSYTVTGSTLTTETRLSNVAGMIPGVRADEYVVFSGHYDHIGVRPGRDGEAQVDSIANGANDDASGTTAVIELARFFKDGGQPERTLLFVAFTAEEAGGYGSRYFSQQLDPDQIVAMFNIEMIGKPAVEGPNTAWITGFDRTDFGAILQRAVEGTEFSFYADPYPDQNLFYRSDNATLARVGVPAHTISTTPIDVDEDYHQVSDEVSTLDMAHMTATIRAIAAGAATIVSGQKTPTRIDPSTVN